MSYYFEPSPSGHSPLGWPQHSIPSALANVVPSRQPSRVSMPTSYPTKMTGGQGSSPSSGPGSAHDDILTKLRGQDLWIVNSRRRNGLIIHKEFYTEFAGPGAAVGGGLDDDCRGVIPLGSLSLLPSTSPEEQQKALKIRLQWVRLTQNFTDKPVAIDRARMILEQFKSYFDPSIVEQVPDEAFALLVGVLPYTVRRARELV